MYYYTHICTLQIQLDWSHFPWQFGTFWVLACVSFWAPTFSPTCIEYLYHPHQQVLMFCFQREETLIWLLHCTPIPEFVIPISHSYTKTLYYHHHHVLTLSHPTTSLTENPLFHNLLSPSLFFFPSQNHSWLVRGCLCWNYGLGCYASMCDAHVLTLLLFHWSSQTHIILGTFLWHEVYISSLLMS
jgi:hypothetical protein